MLDVRALLPGQSTFGRGAASCLVGPASPSPPARCSLAPQGGWAGGSGLRSEPSQVGMSQAGSLCVEVELARKEADSRGGKGHVRILTGVRRRRNTYVCCTPARTEAPGGAGEAGGGKDDGSWLSRSSNHTDKVWRGAPPAWAWEQGTRENQGPSLHPDCVKCSTIKKYFDITCEIKNKLN